MSWDVPVRTANDIGLIILLLFTPARLEALKDVLGRDWVCSVYGLLAKHQSFWLKVEVLLVLSGQACSRLHAWLSKCQTYCAGLMSSSFFLRSLPRQHIPWFPCLKDMACHWSVAIQANRHMTAPLIACQSDGASSARKRHNTAGRGTCKHLGFLGFLLPPLGGKMLKAQNPGTLGSRRRRCQQSLRTEHGETGQPRTLNILWALCQHMAERRAERRPGMARPGGTRPMRRTRSFTGSPVKDDAVCLTAHLSLLHPCLAERTCASTCVASELSTSPRL